jgi:hypothetical protein
MRLPRIPRLSIRATMILVAAFGVFFAATVTAHREVVAGKRERDRLIIEYFQIAHDKISRVENNKYGRGPFTEQQDRTVPHRFPPVTSKYDEVGANEMIQQSHWYRQQARRLQAEKNKGKLPDLAKERQLEREFMSTRQNAIRAAEAKYEAKHPQLGFGR